MQYNNGSSNNSKQIMSNNSIKDNFRTPLPPFTGGGLGLQAFSLIELSIVLIIIGLLVAGVTGGKSLIESAKARSFLNEVRGYKQAIYTFYAAKGRLPGDLNGSGKVGAGSGQTYTSTSFPAPYNSSADEGIPNAFTAPFVDLYLEGVVDFKPKKVSSTGNSTLANNGSLPLSKLSKSFMYFPKYYSSLSYSYVTKIGNWIYLFKWDNTAKNLDAKYFKYVDEKIDDGVVNSGNIASDCGNKSYDDAINDGSGCRLINMNIDVY